MRAAGASARGLLCVAALCLVACAASSEAPGDRSDGAGAVSATRSHVDFAESATTWLLDSVPADFEDLVPPHLGALRLGVVLRDGAPVEGARVALGDQWPVPSEGCESITCAVTDARGRFVLAREDWEAGRFSVSMSSHGGSSLTDPELVTVRAPDGGFAKLRVPHRYRAVSFTQVELGGRELELRLRDELDRPVSGVGVSLLHLPSGESVRGVPVSDADGRMVIGSLPAGCYEVAFRSWIGRVVAQVELPPDAGARRAVDLVLGTGELRLALRRPNGRPATTAQATLIPLEVPGLDVFEGAGDPAAYRVLDADGTRRFTKLPAGRYLLALVRGWRCHDGGPLHALEVEVRVTPGEVLDVALQFPPCDGTGAAPAVAAR